MKKLVKILLINCLYLFIFSGIASARDKVLTGLDVLEKSNFKQLQGKNVGLITNHTAVDNHGEYILDIFSKQKQFKLKAIFTPEHGLRGKEDKEFIASEVYGVNIPVYSLYGDTKKPTAAMLKDLDVLVFDIQDIGTRYYTYITTMAYAMEAAAENKIHFMVLDRPNPIRGDIIEGEVLEPQFKSFTGYFQIPTRYGMTSGEIASYYKGEGKLNLALDIIKLENWKRDEWFDQTGLQWINPSPNMRFLNAAILYPGLGTLETMNLSVGRGTELPFLLYGAPWLDKHKLVQALEKKNFPGLKFTEVEFIPDTSMYANQKNYGFQVEITDRNKVRSVDALVFTVYYINLINPGQLKPNDNNGIRRSFGSSLLLEMLNGFLSPEAVIKKIKENQQKFLPVRKKYLLY
jgi:uncharacterized protein YbbC (DUF1343 family)